MQRHLNDSISLSRTDYVQCIAAATIVAAVMLGFGAVVSSGWPISLGLVLGAFVSAVICIVITYSTDHPGTTFIGVSGMMLSMGCMFGPLVALVGESVAVSVALITVTVMVVMSFIGLVIPKVFEGWGPYLMAGLTLLIVAQFAQIIFMLLGFSEAVKLPILSWFGIALFLGFVAYDWASALKYEYTLDNAIKASGVLGVDFANIYAYIGEFMSGSGSTRKATSSLTSGGGETDLADGLELDD